MTQQQAGLRPASLTRLELEQISMGSKNLQHWMEDNAHQSEAIYNAAKGEFGTAIPKAPVQPEPEEEPAEYDSQDEEMETIVKSREATPEETNSLKRPLDSEVSRPSKKIKYTGPIELDLDTSQQLIKQLLHVSLERCREIMSRIHHRVTLANLESNEESSAVICKQSVIGGTVFWGQHFNRLIRTLKDIVTGSSTLEQLISNIYEEVFGHVRTSKGLNVSWLYELWTSVKRCN